LSCEKVEKELISAVEKGEIDASIDDETSFVTFNDSLVTIIKDKNKNENDVKYEKENEINQNNYLNMLEKSIEESLMLSEKLKSLKIEVVTSSQFIFKKINKNVEYEGSSLSPKMNYKKHFKGAYNEDLS
jgi:hypothetical protein